MAGGNWMPELVERQEAEPRRQATLAWMMGWLVTRDPDIIRFTVRL
jgi:hypothetical protein